MKWLTWIWVAGLGGVIAAALWLCIPSPRPDAMPAVAPSLEVPRSCPRGSKAPAADLLSRLPLAFVENRGQWDADVRFMARRGTLCAFLSGRGLTLVRQGRQGDRLHGVAVRLTFEGASAHTAVTGVDPLPGVRNYFVGDDASRWKTGVRGYGQVRYRGLYSGVDIRFRDQDGDLEYDVELAPWADAGRVIVACEGILGLGLEDDGTLVMQTAAGAIRQKPPTTWQVLPSGDRRAVDCRYRILDRHRYGFAVSGRDRALATVIDPGLVWSTFLGGSDFDYATDVEVDAAGAVTLCGYTESSDFPVQPGSYEQKFQGNVDAFVTRLDAKGSTLVFSTYLGGSSVDFAGAIALVNTGEVVVVGFTQSSRFPTTTGAYARSSGGGGDAFVTRLNATGSALVFSTYLGGSGYDQPYDVTLNAAGKVAVVGLTQSTDFPTTSGVHGPSYNGGGDGFVTLLNAAGSGLDFSTFLGGTGKDEAYAVVLEASGDVILAGQTWGTNNTSNFPTTPGAYDRTYNGGKNDAYVARMDATGKALLFSTLLGGTNSDPVRDIAIAPGGAVTITGQTYSSNFPTTSGAYDTTYGGNGDVYVVRFDGKGSSLEYGSFLGGAAYDEGTALAVESSGAVTVAGWTESSDFPTTPGAYQTAYLAAGDGFVTRLKPVGDAVIYSTYIGGAKWDAIRALALDGDGAAILAGEVWSSDYPTTPGAHDTVYNTWGDAFATRLDMLPKGVTAYGRSTPSCQGPIALGVTRMPVAGAADFAVTCTSAPPDSAGVLAVGFLPSVQGIPFHNIVLHINPFAPFIPLQILSNNRGASTTNIPIPAGITGIKAYCQVVWSNTRTCPGSGLLSASNALELTIQ